VSMLNVLSAGGDEAESCARGGCGLLRAVPPCGLLGLRCCARLGVCSGRARQLPARSRARAPLLPSFLAFCLLEEIGASPCAPRLCSAPFLFGYARRLPQTPLRQGSRGNTRPPSPCSPAALPSPRRASAFGEWMGPSEALAPARDPGQGRSAGRRGTGAKEEMLSCAAQAGARSAELSHSGAAREEGPRGREGAARGNEERCAWNRIGANALHIGRETR